MLYFGSRNFGQANFGKGLITTAVDENLSTSNMDVAGYILFNTSYLDPTATSNIDISSGIQRLGYLHIQPKATIIASGIKMVWQARNDLGSATSNMDVTGYIAWDAQLVDEETWTTQIID